MSADLKSKIAGVGGKINQFHCDLRNAKSLRDCYRTIWESGAEPDVLVNCAGVMRRNLCENATDEELDLLLEVNVKSFYISVQEFGRKLLSVGRPGKVINIASVSGLIKDSQHHPAYNASKAAAIHLSRMLANIVAKNRFKIRINTISPGVFPSEMTTGDSGKDQKSYIPKEKYDKVPAHRPGNEKDIARAIVHLVVNQYINGHNELVDGGYNLMDGY